MEKITFIGLGKLGLPLAALLAKANHKIFAVDKNEDTLSSLKLKRLPFYEKDLEDLFKDSFYNFCELSNKLSDCIYKTDTILILVNTQDLNGGYSSKNVESVVKDIAKEISKKSTYTTVIISSTVPPGSITKLIKILEKNSGKAHSVDFGFAYVPDFVRLGMTIEDFSNPEFFLVGSSDEKSYKKTIDIFKLIHKNKCPYIKLTFEECEIAKVSLNAYVVAKISFANYISLLCEEVEGVKPAKILNAIGHDSRISKRFFSPGTPYGGTCFPRDTNALRELANSLGKSCKIVDFCESTNRELLLNLINKSSKFTNIGIIGISFKDGSPVLTASPSIDLAKALLDNDKSIFWYDPLVDDIPEIINDKFKKNDSIDDLIENSQLIYIMHFNKQYLNYNYSKIRIVDPWGLRSLNG